MWIGSLVFKNIHCRFFFIYVQSCIWLAVLLISHPKAIFFCGIYFPPKLTHEFKHFYLPGLSLEFALTSLLWVFYYVKMGTHYMQVAELDCSFSENSVKFHSWNATSCFSHGLVYVVLFFSCLHFAFVVFIRVPRL